ncbi:MAG: GNAT family N-acetyltransferase [Bacillota bacterium]
MSLFVVSYPWQLYFYYPEDRISEGQFFLRQLNGVKRLELSGLKSLCRKSDLGEIDPNYHGFQEIAKNFVLAAGTSGMLCGFCVFVLERRDVIQIDLLVTAKEWRRKGLGRLLLNVLEQTCLPGTIIYVDQVTETGRKFFINCGFTKDVNLFKVAGGKGGACCPFQTAGSAG